MGKAVTIDIRALDNFSGPLDKIKGKISGLTTQIEKFNTRMSKVSQSLKDTGKAMHDWGMSQKWIAAAVIGAGYASLKASSDYQKLQIRFETLVGSTKEGLALLQKVRDFELKAGPFDSEEIEAAAEALLNYRVAADDIVSTLKTVATLSAGSGLGIESVTQAYGRMVSQGHANPRSLLLLQKTGMPAAIAEILSKKMKKNITQDDVMKGAKTIDYSIVKQAALLLETTKYKDLLEKIDRTTGETFGDTVTLLQRANAEIGTSIEKATGFNATLRGANGYLETLIPKIQKWTDAHPWITKMAIAAAAFYVAVVGIAIVIGPLIVALGIISGIAPAWFVLAATFAIMYTHSKQLDTVWRSIKETWQWIVYNAKAFANAIHIRNGSEAFSMSGDGQTPTSIAEETIKDRQRGMPAALAGSATITIKANSKLFNIDKYAPNSRGLNINLLGPNMVSRGGQG